jgi:mRNA interferase MazF
VRRGELWTVAAGGDYTGKPRPALVVQADRFDANDSIAVCPITTDATESLLRIPIDPSAENGLTTSSRIMIDKITAVRRTKLGRRVGALTYAEMVAVSRSLMVFLGIA